MRWPSPGVYAMWFLPSALNVKVKKFNQAWVKGGSNYDSLNLYIHEICWKFKCLGINIGWQIECKKKFASTCRLFYFKALFNEQILGIYITKRAYPAICLPSCRAYYMYMLEHLQHRKLWKTITMYYQLLLDFVDQEILKIFFLFEKK